MLRFLETDMKTVGLKTLLVVCCLVSSAWLIGCQRTDTTTNANANANANANMLANANASRLANTNTATIDLSTIATREPDQYKATLVLSAETEGGQKTIGIATLSADIAKNGADRRVAFKLPDGSDLIYLEKGDQHLAILPARK